LRGLSGAAVGTVLGCFAVAFLPRSDAAGGFLTGLGFHGWHWLLPATIPLLSGAVAYIATRTAAQRTLRDMP
jgi:cell division transport system permease protein